MQRSSSLTESAPSTSVDLPFSPTVAPSDLAYKGPIRKQFERELTVFHFVIVILLFCAERLGYAPHIRFANLTPYTFVILILYNIDRILQKKLPSSSFLLYSHVTFPFAHVTIIAREAHSLVAVAYICGLFLFYFQTGDTKLARNFYFITPLVVFTYTISTVFMNWFYRDVTFDHSNPLYGVILHTPLRVENTLLVIVVLISLCMMFSRMARFVKEASITTENRTKKIVLLSSYNKVLANKIIKLEAERNDKSSLLQINTPFEIMVKNIEALQDDKQVAKLHEEKFDVIQKCLAEMARGTLFRPLLDEKVNPDVSAWITTTLDLANAHPSDVRKTSKTTSAASFSTLSREIEEEPTESDSENDTSSQHRDASFGEIRTCSSPKVLEPPIVPFNGRSLSPIASSVMLALNSTSSTGSLIGRPRTPEGICDRSRLVHFHNEITITRPLSATELLSPTSPKSLGVNGSLYTNHLRDRRRLLTLPPVPPPPMSNLPTTRESLLAFFNADVIGQAISDWNFSIFDLQRHCKGYPLTAITFISLNQSNLIDHFKFNSFQLVNFLMEIERGYSPLPYHNALHAADVTQCVFFFIEIEGLGKCLKPLERLSLILAAAVHDYLHFGFNNNYLRLSSHDLAIKYNDTSPLENHHIASVFHLLSKRNDLNFLDVLNCADRCFVRSLMISLVLSTDLQTKHVEIVTQFKRTTAELLSNTMSFQEEPVRKLLCQIIIKVADISNPLRPQEKAYPWSLRAMEEFYRQGDHEKERGFPVSSFFDRTIPTESKCQISFIDFVIRPLFEAFMPVLTARTSNFLMDILDSNRRWWANCSVKESFLQEDPSKKLTTLKHLSSSTKDLFASVKSVKLKAGV
ncbi:hypothetical protein RCL1_007030 [Eukaryota sp. TZLM3-RCL]